MRISRIQITNFRNFAALDVALGDSAVIVGDNRIGKSNLLFALRLILDPSLPDSARYLRDEDFWDGLKRPLSKSDQITISVDITDFQGNPNQMALLSEHVVNPKPMVSRLNYAWRPLPGLKGNPTKAADYEPVLYGANRLENLLKGEVRRRLPLELFPALRDCESDLARWSRSPLRPLLDKAASGIDRSQLEKLTKDVDVATATIAAVKQITEVSQSIVGKLSTMVGSAHALQTVLRFLPNDPDRLIRDLRLFVDNGKRGIGDASLGSSNLLYFALKSLEYDQLVLDGQRDHTVLAIEEPEAHLHPSLQRLIFRSYLRPRLDGTQQTPTPASTILMTTHSPHIASVAPIKNLCLLRRGANGGTVAVSTATLALGQDDIDDLERYIDVTRAEFLFARAVILVEGDAERFLLPVLAAQQGIDLDQLGIAVCSIAGTNFAPFLTLIGPKGLDIPLVALTDFDPRGPGDDGKPREALGPKRVLETMLPCITPPRDPNAAAPTLKTASTHGLFINSHTFEVDLFQCGLHDLFGKAVGGLDVSKPMKDRMAEWVSKPTGLDANRFLSDLDSVGKGRFAQRLASLIATNKAKHCPPYIREALNHVVSKCK